MSAKAAERTEFRYSYEHTPTLARFALSNAFIRGILGPVGCLPGDSEFLTPTGWKRMDAYVPGDLVAQWGQGDGSLSFVAPTDYHVGPAGSFFEFDSGSLTMRLSPLHRVPHYDWLGRFAVKTAIAIAAKPSRRKIPTTFVPPADNHLMLSDALIRFAVMMHADGHYPKRGKQAVVTVRKERKKTRIRELLTTMGVEWTEKTYPRRPTETIFSFVPPYRGKRFDGRWWGASQRQCEVIIDEMSHWDGLFDHEETRFSTTYKGDADFIQYAAHAIGRRASIRTDRHGNKRWRTLFVVQIKGGDSYKNCATVRGDTATITHTISPNGTQQYCFTVPSGFFLARCDDTIFVTGNSGKSSASVVEIVRRGQQQAPGPDGVRRTRFAVIRQTYPQLEDTTIKTFHEWLPPKHFGHYADFDYRITGFENCEIEVMFRALDRPDQIANLRSLDLTGAWVNEAREIDWEIIDMLQTRLGRYPAKRNGGPTWYGMWLDTNPPDADSSWYEFFEEEKWRQALVTLQKINIAPTHEVFAEIFRQPSGLSEKAENLPNLPGGRGYYANLTIGKGKEWVDVFVHGKYGFITDGRAIFPEYSDERHCREVEPIPGMPIFRGWDFGLTPACVFSQLQSNGQWLVFDEITSESSGIVAFSEVVQRYCAAVFPGTKTKFIDYGDPAGMQRAQTDEKTCFQILHGKGIMIEPGLQTLATRLEALRKPLVTMVDRQPMFILHPRCKKLRRGFLGQYKFRRLRVSGNRYADDPEKNDVSHPMDGLQYVATRIFGVDLFIPPAAQREAAEQAARAVYDQESYEPDQGRSELTGY